MSGMHSICICLFESYKWEIIKNAASACFTSCDCTSVVNVASWCVSRSFCKVEPSFVLVNIKPVSKCVFTFGELFQWSVITPCLQIISSFGFIAHTTRTLLWFKNPGLQDLWASQLPFLSDLKNPVIYHTVQLSRVFQCFEGYLQDICTYCFSSFRHYLN